MTSNPTEDDTERTARKHVEVTDTLQLKLRPSGMVEIDPDGSAPIELTPIEAATLQKLLAIDRPLPGYRGERFFLLSQDYPTHSANPEEVVGAVAVDADSLRLTTLASTNETTIREDDLPALGDALGSRGYRLGDSPPGTDTALPERVSLPSMVQSVDDGAMALPVLTAERDAVLEYIYERRGLRPHNGEQFVAPE